VTTAVLVVGLLLSAPGAVGSGAVRSGTGVVRAQGSSNVLAWFPFSEPGCKPSGSVMGTKGEAITVARASVAENTVSGAPVSCPTGQLRLTDSPATGILVEPLRTQYLATPDNPATQSMSIPTGAANVIAWVEGVGSAALAQTAGTPTVSNMPCVVTASTPCIFSVTGGSGSATVSFTPSGSVTFGQVEWGGQNPGFRTARMHAAGTRNADVVSVANPMPSGVPGCVCVSATLTGGRSWTSYTGNLWTSTGTVGGANSARIYLGGNGYLYFDAYDGSTVQRRLAYSQITVWADGSTQDVCACISAGCSLSLWTNGFEAPTAPTGTGACTTHGTPIYLGGQANAQTMLGGVISDVRIVRGYGGRAVRPVRLQPYQVAALGDSITSLGAPPYVTTLATLLGTAWKPGNYGAAGERTYQMLPRWYSTVRAAAPGSVVVLGGFNDISNGEAGVNGASVISSLREIYDSARSYGMRLVPVTILPCGKQAAWNASKETLRGQINSWILSYCAEKGIACVDTEATMGDGAGNLAAAYDSGDGLHPNQAGFNALGTLIRSAFP
jgi:lysophospholipase L1-like esterase